jgi:hypothetical protein
MKRDWTDAMSLLAVRLFFTTPLDTLAIVPFLLDKRRGEA